MDETTTVLLDQIDDITGENDTNNKRKNSLPAASAAANGNAQDKRTSNEKMGTKEATEAGWAGSKETGQADEEEWMDADDKNNEQPQGTDQNVDPQQQGYADAAKTGTETGKRRESVSYTHLTLPTTPYV